MKKAEITKLKTPYVSVEGSFGGNQGWFKPKEGATGVDSRGLSVRKAKTLEGFGCGLIGGSDILLHLFGLPEKRKSNSVYINRSEYEEYILHMEKKFFHILPKLGISGVLLAFNLNIYFLLNRRRIKEETGSTFFARWAVLPRNIIPKIKEMLSNDIPVVLAIGPGFFRKNKLNFYNKQEKKPEDKSAHLNVKSLIFKPVTKTKDHYVTVTGVEEYPSHEGTKTMLEISSWGKKYYVNYDEYLEYVRKNDNFYFSNILYIKKK